MLGYGLNCSFSANYIKLAKQLVWAYNMHFILEIYFIRYWASHLLYKVGAVAVCSKRYIDFEVMKTMQSFFNYLTFKYQSAVFRIIPEATAIDI